MAGIQETKDVLAFVFALSEASVTGMETGDIGWSEAKKFIDPLKRIGSAIENIEDVLIELQDLDDAEFEELDEKIRTIAIDGTNKIKIIWHFVRYVIFTISVISYAFNKAGSQLI